jgi:hypothetical protein
MAALGGCNASFVNVFAPGSYSKYCEFFENSRFCPPCTSRYSVPATVSTLPFGCRQAGASLGVSRSVGDSTRFLFDGSPGSLGKLGPAIQLFATGS